MYSLNDSGSSSSVYTFLFFFQSFLVWSGFQTFLGPKIHINEKSKSPGKQMKLKIFLTISGVYIWICFEMFLFQGD